ncbi:MAG: RNA polymerase sigma factor region1.1 domain-containing protein, partial [Gammaproteobacteria bacterium]
MASGLAQQQSRLKKLIALGREQGYLTYAEVNDHLPDDISDPEQIEDIISMINDMGILVQESAPESDDLMAEGDSTDELAAEEAAAVLVAVENETGRTTDPVRMYMREMGTVDLLTREGEIEIAKRIEEGIRDVLEAAAGMPGVVGRTLEAYAATQEEEGKLEDLLIGFLDPAEHVEPAAQVVPGETKDDDDDQPDTGPDAELAAERMAALKKQNDKTLRAIKKHGRGSPQVTKELAALGQAFQFFKFVPKHYDSVVSAVRDPHQEIRKLERQVMTLCVRQSKMD